jgi:1,4-dihydroxy-2-naphthoate octaprenyltransferase
MGANSQQGWALLIFVIGFTFLPAGLFALGPIFSIIGLVCLIVAFTWCYRLKPLEHMVQGDTPENVSVPPKAKRAV